MKLEVQEKHIKIFVLQIDIVATMSLLLNEWCSTVDSVNLIPSRPQGDLQNAFCSACAEKQRTLIET